MSKAVGIACERKKMFATVLLQDKIQCFSRNMTALTERPPKTNMGDARYGFPLIQSNLTSHVKGRFNFMHICSSQLLFQISKSELPWDSGKVATCWINCVHAWLVRRCEANKTQDRTIQSSCNKPAGRMYCVHEDLSVVIDTLKFSVSSVFQPCEALLFVLVRTSAFLVNFADQVLLLHRTRFEINVLPYDFWFT